MFISLPFEPNKNLFCLVRSIDLVHTVCVEIIRTMKLFILDPLTFILSEPFYFHTQYYYRCILHFGDDMKIANF